MLKKHAPNEAAGVTPELAAELDAAAAEMEADTVFDPSALTPQYQADVGVGTFARTEGVSTSPKIPRHDNLWNTLYNAFPELESDEVEELMEYVLGTSIYKAYREHFAGFSQERLEEILALDQEAVEELLAELDEDELDDYDEPETGADEA